MSDGHRHPHLVGTIARIVALVVFGALLLPAIVIDGDLLVLPAAALVLLAWLVIALVALAHWVLTIGVPPLVTTAKTAVGAGWAAIADDPIGERLHRLTRRIRRTTRRLGPLAKWLARRLSLQPSGLPLTLAAVLTATGLGVV